MKGKIAYLTATLINPNLMKAVFIGCLIGVISLGKAQEFIPWAYGNLIGNSYGAEDFGCGVSIADINLDGKDDFTLISFYNPCTAYIPSDSSIQIMDLPFDIQAEVRQITWVDFDNDGDRDLCMTGRNMATKLYRNSSMVLQDVSEELGILTDPHTFYGHSWADYDRDGDLDLFVANYDQAYAGFTNFRNCLYRQNSEGHFEEMAEQLGLVTEVNYSFMGLWTDINNDLWPDLIIINDRDTSPNNLFLNNGDGTFTEISESSNMGDLIFSMSATQGDYNNDGLLDYYITNNPSGNLHKKNLGNNTFMDVAELVGTQLNLFSWSAHFTDFDCDGLEDLHICVSPHINYPHQNQILKNIGDFFIPFTESSGMIPDNGWSRGSAVGDLNDDGFQDIIVSKSYPSVSQFWLSVPNDNNWLKVSLRGETSNRDGIGSWITCHKGNEIYTRYTNCGESYLAQNSFVEHFGLGDIEILDSIVVRWVSGQRDVWKNVPTSQKLVLIEGSSAFAHVQTISPTPECEEMSQEFTALFPHGGVVWMNGDTSIISQAYHNDWVYFAWIDSLGNVFYSDSIQVELNEVNAMTSVIQPNCESHEFGSAVFTLNDTIWSWPLLINDSLVGADYLDSLRPGHYNATINGLSGCSYSVSFAIDTFYRPIDAINMVISDVTCNGWNDGSIQLSSSSSDSIHWMFEDGIIHPDSLSAGDYSIVAWNNACYDTVSVEIFQPSELTMDIVVGPDESSGYYFVALSATGGTSPYEFSIDQIPSSGNTVLGVLPGQHLIQVLDQNNCAKDSIIYLDFLVSVNLECGFVVQNSVITLNRAGNVMVYDCAGRVVAEFHCQSNECQFPVHLPVGAYFAVDTKHAYRPYSFTIVKE